MSAPSTGSQIGRWEPTEAEAEIIRKAAREAFDFMCDGHPYRFEGEVLDAVKFAIARSSLLEAMTSHTGWLLNLWGSWADGDEPDLSPFSDEWFSPPDWWDEVTGELEPADDDGYVNVFRREPDDEEDES